MKIFQPIVSGSLNVFSSPTASVIVKTLPSSSAITNVVLYDTASGQLYYTASSGIGGGSGVGVGFPFSGNAVITGSLLVSGSGIVITGSLNVTGSGITGSLLGTSSYADTASYALNAGSGVGFPFSGSAVITGSLLVSGSGIVVSGSLNVTSGITGSLSGTATNATNVGITNTTVTSGTYYLTFVGNTSGNDNIEIDSSGLTYNPSTNIITGTSSFTQVAESVQGGAANFIPKWTGAVTLGSSVIYQTPSTNRIGIGTVSPQYLTHIKKSGEEILKVEGSGSVNPLFLVEGSQGELFSVTDNISGSLFSVNDKSGLPIIDIVSDSTILMGNYSAQSLNTTVKFYQLSVTESFYQIATSSYDAVYIDYYYKNYDSANVGAGFFISTWKNDGEVAKLQGYSITTAGTEPVFDCAITGGFAELRLQSSVTKHLVKAIIRSI